MRRCYKCQKPYLEPHAPGAQEVCGECGSYLHCCHNCRFFDEYATSRRCREPQAEPASDPHDMYRCDFFLFRDVTVREQPEPESAEGGGGSGGGTVRHPDWRNVGKKDEGARRSVSRRSDGGGDGGGAASGRDGEDRARQARSALDKLFGGAK
jgi:hypothetical protein